ncbi:hypothetical protein BGW80DRAFT_1308557 [Lactifluus volemus]|nr:hypothetical protein BGW80DRAFT_1308557 [Lactifluus volemus]
MYGIHPKLTWCTFFLFTVLPFGVWMCAHLSLWALVSWPFPYCSYCIVASIITNWWRRTSLLRVEIGECGQLLVRPIDSSTLAPLSSTTAPSKCLGEQFT